MIDWKPVSSYKDLPRGLWLVKVNKASHGLEYHTAAVRSNVTVIGGLFAFDQHKVIAYAPIPETDIVEDQP